jgi:hypothetical protein
LSHSPFSFKNPPTMAKQTDKSSSDTTMKASFHMKLVVFHLALYLFSSGVSLISPTVSQRRVFASPTISHRRVFVGNRLEASSQQDDGGPIVAEPMTPSLYGLFKAAANSAIPRGAETREGAHDAFRYEWGRWVDDAAMETLQERVNEIRLTSGVYETLISDSESSEDEPITPRRLRVAGDAHWDCILHVLPKGSEFMGRWPTGSWAVVRCLTGVAEIAMLRGPNRDGFYTKVAKKDLRGGGDGTLAGGSGAVGEDCVKYVGGALRSYAGKSGKTTLLEVVLRPPIGIQQKDGDGRDSLLIEALNNPDTILEVAVLGADTRYANKEEEESTSNDADTPNNLGAKMGMTFEKVGGLDDQLNSIVRRVLASR